MAREKDTLSTASVDIPMLRLQAACFAGIAAAALRGIHSMRNRLPEPFDFFDHVGNVNGSAPAGALLGAATGAYFAKRAEIQPGSGLRRKTRAAMAVGGLVAGVLVNTISETKWGMSLTHIGDTGDPIDFAYGVAASVAAASLAPTIKMEEVTEPTPRIPSELE